MSPARHQGRLTEWNDDRGFGFVAPLDGGPRVFVHVSEFPRDRRRPLAMDMVTYTLGNDDRGRPRAEEVLFLAPVRAARMPQAAPSSPGGLPRIPAILIIMVGLFVATLVLVPFLSGVTQERERTSTQAPVASADDAIARAFQGQQSGVQVGGQGVVERVLSDDTNGSRHQRFILRLPSGQTLLVAHNIDLAPRIMALAEGDSVAFYGVYEWNAEGGVIHWTHHDPDGSHMAGWLKHNGQTFQ